MPDSRLKAHLTRELQDSIKTHLPAPTSQRAARPDQAEVSRLTLDSRLVSRLKPPTRKWQKSRKVCVFLFPSRRAPARAAPRVRQAPSAPGLARAAARSGSSGAGRGTSTCRVVTVVCERSELSARCRWCVRAPRLYVAWNHTLYVARRAARPRGRGRERQRFESFQTQPSALEMPLACVSAHKACSAEVHLSRSA